MPKIYLRTAVAKIHQIVDQRRNRGKVSPFFFIVGAGVSHPPIPLAREIEEHCKIVAAKYGDTESPELTGSIDSYSHWFSKAYPSSEELQGYLRNLMEKLPISKANLRLAHLILDGTVARTVFTPNFDDMLTKALELFGQRPFVCDHPLTVSRMRIESKDIQIIHVHGSYWFYDCCNLKQDIIDRSGNAPMSVMLDQSLRDHSPLVIGYSGWDGDILMTSLKRRLESGRLATPIYWFCYRREFADALPDWLIKHSDVYLVLPEEPVQNNPISSAIDLSETDSQITPSAITDKADETRSEIKDPVLPADRIFDALVRHFKISAPPLTENPLSFYVSQLREFLGTSDPKETEPDTYYSFHTVIGRVERARDAEANDGPDPLLSLRDAMSKADYRRAIAAAEQIDLSLLSVQERRDVVFVLMSASLSLNDDSMEEIAGYDLVVKVGDLFASEGFVDLRVQEQVASALLYKAITLGNLDKNLEAIAAYDELSRRFSNSPEPEIREQLSTALLNKGITLGDLEKSEEAIAIYDELLYRFSEALEPAICVDVAKALLNKGVMLRTLNRREEQIAVYEDLLQRFSDASEPELQQRVAKALLYKGIALRALARNDEALAVYEDLLQRFSDAQEPILREQFAKGLFNRAFVLGELKRNEESIAVYDDLLYRFSDSQELELRELIAKALFNKGVVLSALKKSEESIAAYDDLLHRFSDAQEPAIQERVAKALLNKGVALRALGRSDEEIAAYDEISRRFSGAQEPALQERVAKALLYKGSRLRALKKRDEAIVVYEQLVERFADSQEPSIKEQVISASIKT